MQVEHRLSTICSLVGLVALAGCGTDGGTEQGARHVAGAVTQLGNGDVESYAEVDANGVPTALGGYRPRYNLYVSLSSATVGYLLVPLTFRFPGADRHVWRDHHRPSPRKSDRR